MLCVFAHFSLQQHNTQISVHVVHVDLRLYDILCLFLAGSLSVYFSSHVSRSALMHVYVSILYRSFAHYIRASMCVCVRLCVLNWNLKNT